MAEISSSLQLKVCDCKSGARRLRHELMRTLMPIVYPLS